MRDWIMEYSRRRPPRQFAGEFLDEEGAANQQFGIGGSCFLAFIEDAEGLVPPQFDVVWKALRDALAKPEAQRTPDERHLVKDVPRIANKAILLALGPAAAIDPTDVVRSIFGARGANGLIKLVADDPNADGDPVVTAMVILILRFGRRDGGFMTEIHSTLNELKRQVRQGDLDLMERLLVSTAICVFDLAAALDEHRRLLSELYASDQDWHRAYSSNSPFLDHRFGDPAAATRSRNRYVRIPAGFVIMTAIYVTIGDERRFFAFPPVRSLLGEMKLPFKVHVGRDKNKASAYFAWFTYVAMHPDRYLRTARKHWLSVQVSRLAYYWKDLTAVGLVVLFVCFAGTAGVVWFSFELIDKGVETQLDKWLGSLGTALGAVLGLFKTRKR